jgi:hypothetical protein
VVNLRFGKNAGVEQTAGKKMKLAGSDDGVPDVITHDQAWKSGALSPEIGAAYDGHASIDGNTSWQALGGL